MKMYMKLNQDGYLWDIIEYPYGDYQEIDVTLPLPDAVLAGWWKYENGAFVLDEAKKAEIQGAIA